MPIAGDARAVLEQLTAEARGQDRSRSRYTRWIGKLRVLDAEKGAEQDKAMSTRRHCPSTRCASARRCATSSKRDAILVVDGQEILNFGRQSIPTYVPGHRLNSGAFGTMGVGLPFGVAPRWPSRTRRCSCCTATARSA